MARRDIEIRHKPTDKMWIDCHTKPKQGSPWRRDIAMLMNIPEDYDDEQERIRSHPSLLPEDLACEVPPKDIPRRRSVLAGVQKSQPAGGGNPTPGRSVETRKQLAEGGSVGNRI